jgi:hypothetical protein
MSEHVHMVLHVDIKQVIVLTDNNIVEWWHSLHKGTLLTQLFVTDLAFRCQLCGYVEARQKRIICQCCAARRM